ncbi:hypothetical protein [Absidia glauca]|uniref:Uncharacterized protein n=1 Tax=Absidia glauca TaxID=4829 RepID=A0A168Q0V8_ABSGL|nr:hypothetical protein [Absidia glauca]
MTHRLIHTTTRTAISSPLLLKTTSHLRYRTVAWFGTSRSQWFRRFLSPKEEKELYLGITALFRQKLKAKSSTSNDSYRNIIDQVILGTQSTATNQHGSADHTHTTSTTKAIPLTLKQLGQLKTDIDAASKAKDLAQLDALWAQLLQAGHQIPTSMYNRLIRGYLSCPANDGLDKAKQVVDTMEKEQHRLPTTRTCIYMIQAYLKRRHLNLDDALPYVTMLQHYSLDKLRTPFDCSVMLRYYVERGNNAHAIDFLWKDTMRHRDVIQPGPALYTQYAEWLLSSNASSDLLVDVSRCLVQQFGGPSSSSSSSSSTTTTTTWTEHQVSTWLQVVRRLAQSDACVDAEKLMLCLVSKTNNPMESHDIVKSTQDNMRQGIQAIREIINTYLNQAQDLKVLAFYYRLRQSGVKEEAFGSDLTRAIGNVIGRVEQRQEGDINESKAIANEFGLVAHGTTRS